MLRALHELDEKVDQAFMPLRQNKVANAVFYNASRAAEFSIGWHVISLAGAAFIPSLRPHAARMTVALGVESLLVNQGIKRIFNRQRPDLIEGAPHLRRPKTASFPSGHASSAAMAAVLLTNAVPGGFLVWWTLSGIVGTSRIHARMHHATDVGAGFVTGAILGEIAKRVRPL